MKIMMVTSSLDMGGAETHVVELARALFHMGHEVLTVSAGGRLSDCLVREGIRHVSLPLGRRSPWHLLRSYIGLRRLIRCERPDVIHAHTRPAAWLLASPARSRGIPLIVSAHAHMRAGLWRCVSVWGDRTVAVSEDIRQRLIEAFGVNGDRITVIGNGIDTVRFSPGEWHEGRQRIVFMSRLDGDCSCVADLLCRIAPHLHKAFPRAEILIAGGGDRYRSLLRRAQRVNEQIGASVLRVLGAVDRVPVLLRDCCVFVGVSRCALEAMACGCPVILAGDEGYLGILDEKTLARAVRTNFCARGERKAEAAVLYRDIVTLLSRDGEARRCFGEWGRRTVCCDYSVESMARRTLEVYRGARVSGSGGVLISGYYGFHNVGDEGVLRVLVDNLHAGGIAVTVLSRRPRQTRAAYGVRALGRYRYFAIRRLMRRPDMRLLISGGGSLLQNRTGRLSLSYYTGLVRMAKKAGMACAIYANGLGPLEGVRAWRSVGRVLSLADSVSVRDPDAAAVLRERYPFLEVKQGADPAFLLAGASPRRVDFLWAHYGLAPDGRYLAVALRPWPPLEGTRKGEGFRILCEALGRICDRYGWRPLYLIAQAGEDEAVSRRVCQTVGRGGRVLPPLSPSDTIGLMRRVAHVFSIRLHPMIFAALAGCSFSGIAYDPKVASVTAWLGVDVTAKAPPLSVARLCELTDRAVAAAAHRGVWDGAIRTMQNLATADLESLIGLYEALDDKNKGKKSPRR